MAEVGGHAGDVHLQGLLSGRVCVCDPFLASLCPSSLTIGLLPLGEALPLCKGL